MKKELRIMLDDQLYNDLMYLHNKVGPINPKTGKRRPFPRFIRRALRNYADEQKLLLISRGKRFMKVSQEDLDSYE